MDEASSRAVNCINGLKNSLSNLDATDRRTINDLLLLQTLRFNKMDVKKAEEAIRANLLWRKENNIEALETEELCPEIANKLALFIDLKCKDGGPFVYFRVTDGAIPKLWRTHGKDRLFRYLAHIFVKMEQRLMKIYRDADLTTEELVKKDKLPSYRGTYDAQGFSLKQATCFKTIQFYLEFTKLFLNYFPCLGSRANIVNATRPVELVLRLINPLVESRGVQLSVYGDNPANWDSEVYDLIDLKTFREIQERANILDIHQSAS